MDESSDELGLKPPARFGAAMANNSASGNALLFGGFGPDGYLNDTWVWNGQNWAVLSPSTAPEKRADHALVFHAASGKYLLFGGRHDALVGGNQALGNTWSFDGTTWLLHSVPTSPPPRFGASMIYHPGLQKVLLFGGTDGVSTFRDTWEWTFDGTNSAWQDVTTGSEPPARTMATAAFDSSDGTFYIVGGRTKDNAGEDVYLKDAWKYSGSGWTQVTSSGGMTEREGALHVYDPNNRQHIAFGGLSLDGTLDDAKRLDSGKTSWAYNGKQPAIPARAYAAATWHSSANKLVFFGGQDARSGALDDTWAYDPAQPEGSRWSLYEADACNGEGCLAVQGLSTCGTPDVLTDSFDDAFRNSFFWTISGDASLLSEDKQAVVTLKPKTSHVLYGNYVSTFYFDMRGTRTHIEVPQMVNTTTSASARFALKYLQTTSGNPASYEIEQKTGKLYCYERTYTTLTTHCSVPYDAAQHRWWQFRESGGTLYFEASADGTSFTTLGTAAGAEVDTVKLQFGASSYESIREPGAARFDNLNGGLPKNADWCDPYVFSDVLKDGSVDKNTNWFIPSSVNCDITRDATGLKMEPHASQNVRCQYATRKKYDLRNGKFHVRMPGVLNPEVGSNKRQSIAFYASSTNWVRFSIVNGTTLVAEHKPPSSPDPVTTTLSYDPIAHRWLGLQSDGQSIWFHTSSDSWNWETLLAVQKSELELRQGSVYLEVEGTTGLAPGAAVFDYYNTTP